MYLRARIYLWKMGKKGTTKVMKSLLLLRCCGWCYCFCGCCRCYYYFCTLDSIACLCFFCFADLWAHKNRLNDDPIWCVCLRTYFICFLLSSSFSSTSSSFLRLSFVPILPVSACFILICVLRVRVSNMLNAQVFFVAMHSPYAHSLITHEMVCVFVRFFCDISRVIVFILRRAHANHCIF